jgi:hypothetical protein
MNADQVPDKHQLSLQMIISCMADKAVLIEQTGKQPINPDQEVGLLV